MNDPYKATINKDTMKILKNIHQPSEPVCVALLSANPHLLFDLTNITPAIVKTALADGSLNKNVVQQFAAKNGINS